MGLTHALNLGTTALNAAQLAIQVTGDNFANAATPGYSRRIVGLESRGDTRIGQYFIGQGVRVTDIQRSINNALEGRIRGGVSDEFAAGTELDLLSSIEATLNELSDNDLSSALSRFFNSWSELANSPDREGTRALVIQEGEALASTIKSLRSNLNDLTARVDIDIQSNSRRVDVLLGEIAGLNADISVSEAGVGTSNALRDQRGSLIRELSEYIDVDVIEQTNGMVDIHVGSTPILLGDVSRGVEMVTTTDADGDLNVTVNVKANGQPLNIRSGRLGSLLENRETAVRATVERLDTIASELIFEVNKLHSTGYSDAPLESIRSTRVVPGSDRGLAFNDPTNTAFNGLPFSVSNGSLLVKVRNSTTGAEDTVRVEIDLDGIDNTGAAGFGDDTSLDSLVSDLDAIGNLSATINADGTVSIEASSGFEFSFEEDNSGALAVLGINTYFSGDDGTDIEVRPSLLSRPDQLSTGRVLSVTDSEGGLRTEPSDNGTALAIVALQDAQNSNLSNYTIQGSWTDQVQSIGSRTNAAQGRSEAATVVRENLDAQRAGVSGVNVDEEAINLLNYQRQYQGAARFITVVDEMTQILLSLV